MIKRSVLAVALLAASSMAVEPARAQTGGRVSLMPYVGYGFLGKLPGTNTELDPDVAFGGRAAFALSEQFALFGNFQRTTPTADGVVDREATVDHWSAGVEFSYTPRGGAEGMLPILFEAGLGQARYDFAGVFGNSPTEADIAANLGIASALQLNPNFGIRYGVNDYISNFRDEGIVNQVYVHVGAEVTF